MVELGVRGRTGEGWGGDAGEHHGVEVGDLEVSVVSTMVGVHRDARVRFLDLMARRLR
uniref:Uncharacterized protein n=1 Tax=Arundo donax TaxID=35708 RepID=A0A0A8YNT7_ARUDO